MKKYSVLYSSILLFVFSFTFAQKDEGMINFERVVHYPKIIARLPYLSQEEKDSVWKRIRAEGTAMRFQRQAKEGN